MRRNTRFAPFFSLAFLSACSAVVSPDPRMLGGRDGSVVDDAAMIAEDGAAPCAAPLVACGSRCLDLSADVTSCGECGRACASGQICVSGVCACPPGNPACGSTRGLTDPTSCGAASVPCRADQLCIDGACRCRPPLGSVGDACVDFATDPDNCGMPGMQCRGGVCAMGRCMPSCPDGTRECDNACVNLRSDPLNCGECGRACRNTEACQDGECRDIEIATGCTSCPCEACRGNLCCTVPRYEVPYCLDADRCP